MTICNETLTFFTPYHDLTRMIGALKKVLYSEIEEATHKDNVLKLRLSNHDRIFITYFTKENAETIVNEQIQLLYTEVNSRQVDASLYMVKENVLTQIQLMNSIYVVEFEYDEDFRNERIVSLMDVSDYLNALILWETGDISNSFGDIILSTEGESEVELFYPMDEASLTRDSYPLDEEQKKRLLRSTQFLRYKGIYAPANIVIPNEGPYFINVDEYDIAKKAVSCMIIAMYANLLADKEWTSDRAYDYVSKMIDLYQANGYFSNDEIDFLSEKVPSREAKERYQGYYEYSYVMLWALGYEMELAFPDARCDASLVVKTIFNYSSIEGLVKHAHLQSTTTLLDELDLIQRYAWSCRYSIKNKYHFPANMDPMVVVYRNHAIKWLISNQEEVWHKVDMKISMMEHN